MNAAYGSSLLRRLERGRAQAKERTCECGDAAAVLCDRCGRPLCHVCFDPAGPMDDLFAQVVCGVDSRSALACEPARREVQ